MCTGLPVTRWVDVAQSPADHTPSALRRLAIVDEHGATGRQLDAGVLGERRARLHADAEDDELGLDRSVGRQHRSLARTLRRRRRSGRRCRATASPRRPAPEVDVDDAERLRPLLHHRRRAPALDVRLGHLQADVAAADDDDAPARLRGQGQQRLGVVERLHAVDEREVDAGQVGSHRRAARRQHQLVEADAIGAARRAGRGTRPRRRRGRWRSPRGSCARRCRAGGARRAIWRRGRRRLRRRRRRRRTGCRTPSSW